ncbi:MAG TPA: hypothetical protein VGG85_04605 [Terracidiphilus sp.]|jgi:hypothetical protein
MADNKQKVSPAQEPSGFTPHRGGLASEYAREQGWGINQDERTKTAEHKQDYDGGKDYDYGARDFGDSAVDTSEAQIGGDPGAPGVAVRKTVRGGSADNG